MNVKIAFVVTLVSMAFIQVSAQTSGQSPVRSVEERVADEFKEKRLRKAAEETMAAEESNRIAKIKPEVLLSQARTTYINSDTKFFEEVQLQNALSRRPEFKEFELAILDGWANSKTADLWIEIDRPLFTYTFTMKSWIAIPTWSSQAGT